ncbi:hypothetical protein QCA50_004711 [Cerrena zonata]|uniref:Uncharacterized protein n=1 Tax=Cerrena zonata TaxID=2478898 RepID=A0AAW0GN35_9APHY
MAPSAKIRHRFQNSLDIVAARSFSYVDLTQPSGTDNAWSIVDSPTLGRLSTIHSPALRDADVIDSPILGRMSGIARRLEWLAAEPSPMLPTIAFDDISLEVKKVNIEPLHIHKKSGVTPLDIKKIRRRGLPTGVQLILPPSPLPPPRSPLGLPPLSASTPQTALTFTAEFDLGHGGFIFTPFQTSYPSTATSPNFIVSPVPDDVGLETMSVADTHHVDIANPPSPASSTGSNSPCSEIFDIDSIYQSRKMSSSTAPSSAEPLSARPQTSTSSFTKELTIHLFEEELHRNAPNDIGESKLDKEFYDEIDEDLLAAPMDVFERMLWESTVETELKDISEAVDVKPSRLSYGDKIDPDVPRNQNVTALDEESPTHERRTFVPSPRGPRPRRKRNFSEDFLGGVFHKH